MSNNSSNFADEGSELDHSSLELWQSIVIAVFLSVLILVMVVGNLFVILAILVERDLQRPQYYLILSLALADLLVGVVVSPLATVYEVERRWSLGVGLCDFWISMDVMACTSSILHLVAIALDRYWSITDVVYIQKRTPRRIAFMLCCVWVVAIVVSVAPMLGWKDSLFEKRVNVYKQCLISQDLGYQVFSTTAAFYGPLILIIFVYYQIFKAAKRRIRKTREKRQSTALTLNATSKQVNPTTSLLSTTALGRSTPTQLLTPRTAVVEPPVAPADHSSTPDASTGNECNGDIQLESGAREAGDGDKSNGRSPILRLKKRRSRESPEAKRERKAWRTLVIITGTFVGCWLPFFVLAVARPICKCQINPVMESVFLWLGYLNSALNPIIYTIFSPDFRNGFKRLATKMCILKL